jgi:hypothetical protein
MTRSADVSSRDVDVEKLFLSVQLSLKASEWDKKKWCRRLTMLFTDDNADDIADMNNADDADNAKANEN